MVILRRCMCFDNVRSGSIAAGIYTLIYTVIYLAYNAWQISLVVPAIDLLRAFGVSSTLVNAIFGILCTTEAVLALIVIASILLLVGVSLDQRRLLLPYMVVMPMVILIHGAYGILIMVTLARTTEEPYERGSTLAVFELVFLGFVALFDFASFLCVVSQFQELQAGRGRLQDVITARTRIHTTLIASAAPVSNTVVVTQHGGPAAQHCSMPAFPPQQGYPNPQQGYPNPQQGYPNPQQGYPNQPLMGYAARAT